MAERRRGRTTRGVLTMIAALATAISMTVPATAAPPLTSRPAQVTAPRAAVPPAIAPMWVAASNGSMAVLGKNGRVYTWGNNGLGQLGNGKGGHDGDKATKPVQVKPGQAKGVKFTAVAAGSDHFLALGKNGRVYAWGDNSSGQLGNGKGGAMSRTPVLVKTGAAKGVTFTAIAAGEYFSMALGSDGQVYAWGDNSAGELGNGKGKALSRVPVRAKTPSGVSIVAIAAGYASALALGRDGHVYSWGLNENGQLGDGTRTNRNSPVRVLEGAAGDLTFTAITAADYHSVALGSDGRAYSWGNNFVGSLGTGDRTDSSVPVLVSEGAATHVKYTAIAANNFYTLALGSDGVVYHWGEYGIAPQKSFVPQRLKSGAMGSAKAIQIAAGYTSAIVLADNDHVYTIGSGNDGQLGNGKTKGSTKMVAVKDKKIPLKGIAKKVAASRR